MSVSDSTSQTRRRFLLTVATTLGASQLRAGDPPPSTLPRATSGDEREPDWSARLTLTVGPNRGDIMGTDDKAIQAAVDYVARLGGGTIHVLPGTYRLRNAIFLPSRVRLLGSGVDSVLFKEPSRESKLLFDSDWYDQEITLADAAGFRVGDGVCLRAKNAHNDSAVVIKRTLIARTGNRFKLDRALRENLWFKGEARAESLHPLVTAENVADIAIENIVLDGNRKQNANLDGNYGGCIFLQDCQRVRIAGVHALNNNGDGISWQICHDASVTNCQSRDNAGLGLHPGSGSQRPVIQNNVLVGNDIGIFFCWGVKQGRAVNNRIQDSKSHGVSIGHRDTDNLVADNSIERSGKVGVLFRPERGKAFAPHRNRIVKNRIADSGADQGVGIDIQGETEQISLVGNVLRETRQPLQRVGIRIAKTVGDVSLTDNRIEGFAKPISDQRVG